MKTQTLASVPDRSGISALLLTAVLLLSIVVASCGRHSPHSYDHRGQGWIGVYIQDIDPEMRKYLKLDSRRGALVNDVVEDSPAERAGLRKEDVIVKFDGKEISDTEDLSRAVARMDPGEKARVEVMRGNRKKKLKLEIAEQPRRYSSRSRSRHPSFRYRRNYLGIQTADLDDELADYFKVDANQGVLVVSVSNDGPAEDAGIKSGDVILKVENEPIRDTEDLRNSLSNIRSEEKIEVELLRKGKKKKLTVDLSRDYSLRFDRHDRRNWKKNMKNWKRRMREWRHDLKSESGDENYRIQLDIPLEELGDKLEHEPRFLDNELEAELHDLQTELGGLRIEINIDDIDEAL